MVFSLVSGLQEKLGEMVDEMTVAANAAANESSAQDDKQDEVSVTFERLYVKLKPLKPLELRGIMCGHMS